MAVETKQWTFPDRCDRAKWGPGPWNGEPDKMQWTDPATGLDCLIVRNTLGALCGYVGVTPGHPYHGVHYGGCLHTPKCGEEVWCDYSPEACLNVHGGVTYSDSCADMICHVTDDPADATWWFGFDCGHCDDYVPGMASTLREIRSVDLATHRVGREQTYRDVAYVQNQIASLASQLNALR